jgi:hypothetical protein
MSRSSATGKAGRRRFLRVVGGASLASVAAGPAALLAQGGKPDKSAGAAPPPAAAPAPPATPPAPSEDALALAAMVKRRYGQHLTEGQLDAVTREIENRLQGGRRLRDAKLANADEPDTTFHA